MPGRNRILEKGEEIRRWKKVFAGVVNSDPTSTGIGIALGTELRTGEKVA